VEAIGELPGDAGAGNIAENQHWGFMPYHLAALVGWHAPLILLQRLFDVFCYGVYARLPDWLGIDRPGILQVRLWKRWSSCS
jgi:hypothetical protein